MELLGMKNRILEMQPVLDRINRRLDCRRSVNLKRYPKKLPNFKRGGEGEGSKNKNEQFQVTRDTISGNILHI